MNLLTHELTYSVSSTLRNLLTLSSSAGGAVPKFARDKRGGTELSGLGARVGGAAFSQTDVLEGAIHYSFAESTLQRCRCRQVPYLNLH